MGEKDKEEFARQWQKVAMVYGFNELANQAKTLGEKVFFRMARDTVEDALVEEGFEVLKRDQTILQLPFPGPPFIRFTEKDIELMRETVKQYDEGLQTLVPCGTIPPTSELK